MVFFIGHIKVGKQIKHAENMLREMLVSSKHNFVSSWSGEF